MPRDLQPQILAHLSLAAFKSSWEIMGEPSQQKLNGAALFVTDPSCDRSSPFQTPPFFKIPIHTARTCNYKVVSGFECTNWGNILSTF